MYDTCRREVSVRWARVPWQRQLKCRQSYSRGLVISRRINCVFVTPACLLLELRQSTDLCIEYSLCIEYLSQWIISSFLLHVINKES